MDIKLLKISDFNNNFEEFVEACYSCYLSIWKNEVKFNNKLIVRNIVLEDGKEKDFWGVAEGHTNDTIFNDLLRYETVPYLKYILEEVSKTNNNNNSDIIWFYSERGKVNILSKNSKYLVVLKESKTKIYFVTAFPVSQVKVDKINEKWRIYWKTNIRSNWN